MHVAAQVARTLSFTIRTESLPGCNSTIEVEDDLEQQMPFGAEAQGSLVALTIDDCDNEATGNEAGGGAASSSAGNYKRLRVSKDGAHARGPPADLAIVADDRMATFLDMDHSELARKCLQLEKQQNAQNVRLSRLQNQVRGLKKKSRHVKRNLSNPKGNWRLRRQNLGKILPFKKLAPWMFASAFLQNLASGFDEAIPM